MKSFDEKEAEKLSRKLGDKASEKDVHKIEEKLNSMNKGPVAKIWDKVLQLWDAFKNPSTPVYRKTLIIGGLLYLILPTDIVPDFIPAIGFLDDVSVILMIAKQTVELAAGTIIEKVKNPIDEKIKEKINEILNKAMKNTIIATAITFLITALGMFFVIVKPFGQDISFHVAAVIFIGLMIWSLYRSIKWISSTWPWIKSIWREKNIKKGIIVKVKDQYHALEIYENILEKGSRFIEAFNDIPDLEQIFDHYVECFRNRVLIFAGSISVYCLVVYWFLKPFLISQFGGLKLWELYLYPVVHVWMMIFG